MTSAAVVFCCVVALGLIEGYGAPAFAGVLAADAFSAVMPLLGVLLVARFVARRYPHRSRMAARTHAGAQGFLVTLSFGWWWVEPHALLTSVGNGSLSAMGWQGIFGAAVGYALARLAERTATPLVATEAWLGAWALLMLGGGRLYRVYDHVEAGVRLRAFGLIVGSVLVAAILAWLLLRRRERVAAALVALAPAAACAALLLASRSPGPAALSERESVLVVLVDTLRADVADEGFDGEKDVMPELARIAREGTRFTQAVSPSPWTLPATVSLLSGWNPHRHLFGTSASSSEVLGGDPSALYLPSALRDAGYLAAAFVNNPWLRPYYGLDEGFLTLRPYHGRALDGVALLMSWMQDHMGMASFTLLHLMDPHWPYEAPPGFGAERQDCAVCDSLFFTQFGANGEDVRAEVRRRYAAEVRYTDAVLGRLYDTLEATGVLERTWLVVTSDHGEELWDHGGFLHGHDLHDELLRVPLVVVPPRSRTDAARGVRTGFQVRLEDVAATVLEIAGLDASRARDGRSLLPLLAGAAPEEPHTAVAGLVKSPDDLRYAVRRPPWKAVAPRDPKGFGRLYDIVADPAETTNMIWNKSLPPLRALAGGLAWKQLMAEPERLGLEVQRRVPEARGAQVDADRQRQLRSLGYAE